MAAFGAEGVIELSVDDSINRVFQALKERIPGSFPEIAPGDGEIPAELVVFAEDLVAEGLPPVVDVGRFRSRGEAEVQLIPARLEPLPLVREPIQRVVSRIQNPAPVDARHIRCQSPLRAL